MKRVIGYGLFWASGGMVTAMLLENLFIQILLVILFILIGYRLYCFR